MKQVLNTVCRIKHVKLTAITDYQTNNVDKAIITWTSFREIPFVKASVSCVIDPSKPVNGKRWKVTINARMKKKIKNFELGILIVKLESGETLVIGDKEFPVDVFLPESTTQKTLEITHEMWHEPYFLVS